MTDAGFLNLSLYKLLLICALPLMIAPAFEYLAVAAPIGAIGSRVFMLGGLAVALLFLVALVGVVVAPLLFFARSSRRLAARLFGGSVVLGVTAFSGLGLANHVRTRAFDQLARRSAPLVEAIRLYERRHGEMPVDLSALVPEFVREVPKTGMAAYPNYEYYRGAEAAIFDGNPWVLLVRCPRGVLNWDQFMYFALQNYPRNGYGGSLERIGDWAYVHE